MSIESIYQEINNTTFLYEWSRNKKFLGNIFGKDILAISIISSLLLDIPVPL